MAEDANESTPDSGMQPGSLKDSGGNDPQTEVRKNHSKFVPEITASELLNQSRSTTCLIRGLTHRCLKTPTAALKSEKRYERSTSEEDTANAHQTLACTSAQTHKIASCSLRHSKHRAAEAAPCVKRSGSPALELAGLSSGLRLARSTDSERRQEATRLNRSGPFGRFAEACIAQQEL